MDVGTAFLRETSGKGQFMARRPSVVGQRIGTTCTLLQFSRLGMSMPVAFPPSCLEALFCSCHGRNCRIQCMPRLSK